MSNTSLPTTDAEAPRPAKEAIRRGMRCRCPACGEGKLFTKYLQVAKTCPSCGEELFHHRADDGPAYLTILIICHIAGFMLHLLFSYTGMSPMGMTLVILAVVIPSTLVILPIAKGFMVAIQWANRMHGFGRKPAA